MKIQNFALAMICTLLVSCTKWGNSENNRLMKQAQLLLDQKPDSALVLIDAVNTALLSDAKRAEHTLLRVMAKDNAGMNITTDTEILRAREYFIHRNDPGKTAFACFYTAKTISDKDNVIEKMKYYQEALDFVQKTDNKLLQGKILYNMGYLNYNRRWYAEAIYYYQQAMIAFKSAEGQYHREINAMNAIANSFLVNNQQDSAQYYYKAALKLANLHDNPAIQAIIYNNMSVAYRELGQLDTAYHYGRRSLSMATTNNGKVNAYMNLAQLSFDKNLLDSARNCLVMSETLYQNMANKNPFAQFSLNKLRYQVEKKDGNLEMALHYQDLYTDYQYEITQQSDRQLLLEMQRKYNLAVKETEHNREMNTRLKWIGGLALVLLVLAGVCYKMLQKNQKQKAELEITKQQISTLHEMYQQRDNNMKKMFLKKMGIAKSIAVLTPYIDDNLMKRTTQTDEELIWKMKQIVKKLKTQNFVEIANEILPEFTVRLKNVCPDLDDREISICCLELFNFNNEAIDMLVNERYKGTTQTVQNWKTTIRRKLKMQSYGNLQEFLMNIYNERIDKLDAVKMEKFENMDKKNGKTTFSSFTFPYFDTLISYLTK